MEKKSNTAVILYEMWALDIEGMRQKWLSSLYVAWILLQDVVSVLEKHWHL